MSAAEKTATAETPHDTHERRLARLQEAILVERRALIEDGFSDAAAWMNDASGHLNGAWCSVHLSRSQKQETPR